jgi:UDP-glucose 4-epimerase
LQAGVIQALFGAESLTDFLHIDNMIQAHILAAKALTKEEDHKAVINHISNIIKMILVLRKFIVRIFLFSQAGQAYFISDGAPINTFAFFRPLVSKAYTCEIYLNI